MLVHILTQLQAPEVSQSDKARAEQLKAEGKLEHHTVIYTADVDTKKQETLAGLQYVSQRSCSLKVSGSSHVFA